MDPIVLRDQTTTNDPRMNRLVQFDERSRNFPVRAALRGAAANFPRSYTWKCAKHLDQGSEGACVGFSMTHELNARPCVIKNVDDAFARNVYFEAQRIDPWPGGMYPGASPQYEGTSVLAGIKTLKKMGYIKEYRWAFGLEDLVLAIGHIGPAVLGINWYEGMLEPWSCGHLHVTGDIVGGHAILCKGVNIKNKTFTLHNSWGTSWGKNGDALITWEDMKRLLHEDGEAVIPMVRTKP